MAMNPRTMVPQKKEELLLDFAGGAAAAYSLRRLSSAYAGPVVRGRRGVDAAQRDFSPEELTDGTVAAWCAEVGATGVTVTKWYDQSGNGNHAEQAISQSMPVLYSAATGPVLESGKPAILFDGGLDYMTATPGWTTASTDISVVCVFTSVTTLADEGVVYQVTPNYPETAYVSLATNKLLESSVGTNNTSTLAGSSAEGGPLNISSNCVTFHVANLGVATPVPTLFGNGVPLTDGYSGRGLRGDDANLTSPIVLGRRDDGVYYHNGTISELIIYPSDMTAQRERIEGNIAWAY